MSESISDSDIREGYRTVQLGPIKRSIPSTWDVVRLEEIADVKRGASPRPIGDSRYFGGDIGWVRISDMSQSGKYLSETQEYLSDEGVKESVRAYPGEVLLSISASVGRPAILNIDACIHDGLVILRDLNQAVDRDYLYYALNDLRPRLLAKGQTGTQSNVNSSIVRRSKITLPPHPEQRRIGKILSHVDEKLKLTDEIIKKTNELKRGLMQDFFRPSISKGKETQFGLVPKDWECGQIRDFEVSFISGGTPSRSEDRYFGGDIPWLKTGEVQNSRVSTAEEYITKAGLENSSAKLVPKRSVLVAMYGGGTVGNVGLLEIEATTNQACCAIQTDDSILDNEFLYYQLLFEHRRLVSYAAGSSQQNLSKQDVEQFDILVPPKSTQKEIANVLSKTDQKLEVEESLKQNLSEIKQGLMQDLLTGEVQVNID